VGAGGWVLGATASPLLVSSRAAGVQQSCHTSASGSVNSIWLCKLQQPAASHWK